VGLDHEKHERDEERERGCLQGQASFLPRSSYFGVIRGPRSLWISRSEPFWTQTYKEDEG